VQPERPSQSAEAPLCGNMDSALSGRTSPGPQIRMLPLPPIRTQPAWAVHGQPTLYPPRLACEHTRYRVLSGLGRKHFYGGSLSSARPPRVSSYLLLKGFLKLGFEVMSTWSVYCGFSTASFRVGIQLDDSRQSSLSFGGG